MWAVGWLRDGLRLWPWAGLRGGLRVGSVAVDRAVGRAAMRPTQPMGGHCLLRNQPTKYVIHTNTYIFNINMYMFSVHIFFRASGATEAAAYSGPRPIRRTYRGGHSLHHCQPRLATTYQVNMYIFTYICMYFITIFVY